MRLALKFLHLPFTDQWLLIQSAFLLVAVRLALRLFGFRIVWKSLTKMGSGSRGRQGDIGTASAESAIWAVEVMSGYLLPNKPCLTKALVAQVLLTRRGCTTSLRIGVARSPEGRLQAHAWLENDGKIVVGDLQDLSRFTPLPLLEISTL